MIEKGQLVFEKDIASSERINCSEFVSETYFCPTQLKSGYVTHRKLQIGK
ncbi:MAG: hypothetical protein NT084_01565 [Bacteroidetes bacterium]|nr:hypothetical protein [Bacteroidota bacterium]